jgi:pimeloyl-ACP methyl ester carboxylesterase
MARWRRLTSAAGLATGIAAASVGAVIAAEKIAVGRLRMQPDPAALEPFGMLRGQPVTVVAKDGVPLHAEVSGRLDAPVTIVFCHGYTLNQDVWHYQRQDLEQDARLVFWDQRSHGRSGRSEPAHISIDQLGTDLADVLAATVPAGSRVVLVGHSMGGMTIMALADQQPALFGTLIRGVVLISTAASDVDAAGWLPTPLRPAARLATPPIMRASAGGRRADLVEYLRRSTGDLAFLSTRYIAFGDRAVSPATVDFLERVIRATPIDVVADFFLALREHDKRHCLDVLGRVPVTVLAGAQDRLIPARLTENLAAGIPGARLVVAPGAGHAIILERPDIVSGEIAGMAARAAQPAGRLSWRPARRRSGRLPGKPAAARPGGHADGESPDGPLGEPPATAEPGA